MSMPAELLLNPFPLFAQMRKNSPVFFNPDQGMWSVYRYNDVRAILHDHANFSSELSNGLPPERFLTESLISTDPPRHTMLRNLISRAFTPKVIAEMEEQITATTNELLDRVLGNGEMDLVSDFAVPLPIWVIAGMLGIPFEMRAKFKKWSNDLVESSEALVTGDYSPKPHLEASFAEMKAYLAEVAEERRQNPGDDLITRLVHAEIEGQHLTHQELINTCVLLLVAGNETTTNLITNGVRCFLENPDQLALLRQDRSLLPSAIEEILRFRSPAQSNIRLAMADVEIGGHQIKAGQRVVYFVGSANRDEEVFADADRFDITRNPNPHIAFGHGVHFCLGAPLARLEARVAFTALLDRLDDWELAPGAVLEPLPTILIHGVRSLPLRFTARPVPVR